jgi:selenide,water dikinase
LPPVTDERLLVGYAFADDAGVYRVSDDLALIQTVDVFTAIVDDPYDYGRIVAANCLSDCYAMGGVPITAMNIVGFSTTEYPLWVMSEMLKGGSDKLIEAGVTLCGGHTIDDLELKYGMSITGVAKPSRFVTNAAARCGDKLVLTKPLGTGILSTALKKQLIGEEVLRRITKSMAELNRRASEVMVEVGAHACTDITGFGILGHGTELAKASGVALRLSLAALPKFPEAIEHAQAGATKGLYSNRGFFAEGVEFHDCITEPERLFLFDAQTSGGLLVALPEDAAREMVRRLHDEGYPDPAIVGAVLEEPKGKIIVEE